MAPIFQSLAKMIAKSGARCFRIGFNAGDAFFWSDKKTFIPFTDPRENWPQFFQETLDARGITDIVLYGDTREIHAQAVEIARDRGLTIHMFEEGYLRPYWVTYEREGANGNSRLMKMSIDDMRKSLRNTDMETPLPPSHWGDMRHHIFYGALYHWFVMFAWREDHSGWTMHGMRLWKRKRLKQFFGQYGKVRFSSDARDQNPTYWANKAPHDIPNITRMEDGFLRSRGLGAELIPPLSLVTDRQGIYFDPTRQSDLETIIRNSTSLRQDQLRRAENLRDRILAKGLSKYNLGGASLDLPEGYKILVPGQVEDDASIRLGTDKIKTNLDLLKQVRHDFPEAILIYKPHPDVEAGLRTGKIPHTECKHYADVIADQADAIALLDKVDAVATMTSLMGFEALLRGKMVHTYGAPFYAGWGLTEDHEKTPARHKAQITLDGLTYACLIAYPRYFDPILRLPCPPEVALTRMAQGQLNNGGLALRTLAKLQGLFASCAPLWRK